ncbi:hypothetical protein BTA51_26175 [Hahella sp. CCB-MM4]|uniref:4Fe-4S single cluster domain-containing protein n=1 Tax=Hahella sp. (strain CCB-MM4) TaxID=1926491 RepID=UPI000B9BF15F|nr:4Fe-4S single cluster domain-containing protein [Hahella sp. CCB-MM4]OZG70458.1 hypothetical protein BTA51_26175 [Hahella sp. CCB-MM4]
MNIALSRMHFPVTTLGPGRRIGIWFQGCSIHCVGCVSKDTWATDVNQVNISEVEEAMLSWLPNSDGLTVSGGEPFDQFEQLLRILCFTKSNSSVSTLVYSGYHFADIEEKLKKLAPLVDILISGPFDFQQAQTKPWMGSDNQQLHLLTDLGKAAFADMEVLCKSERGLDARIDTDEIWLAGIGEQDLMYKLAAELSNEGHEISHTQTRIPEKD